MNTIETRKLLESFHKRDRYEAALELIRDNPRGISDRDTIARMRDIATKALKGE